MPSSCACSTVKPLTVVFPAWSRMPLASPAASMLSVQLSGASTSRHEQSYGTVVPSRP